MKIHILILILLCVIHGTSFAKQEKTTEIDSAAQILDELMNEAGKDLDALDQVWADKQTALNAVVSSWEVQENAQATTCKDKFQFQTDVETAIATNQHYIQWISDKIADDLARLEKLGKDRCDNQKNYISGLKHDKVMLRLIDYLIIAINKYDPNRSNFLEKQQLASDITAFIHFYQTENYKELLQLHTRIESKINASNKKKEDQTVARTAEQVGQQHIDENANREKINLDGYESGDRVDWPTYKKEVLDLLENLRDFLTKKIARNQEDEVNAGIATAEFKLQLEKELQDLDRALYAETSKTAKLEKSLVIAKNDYNLCSKELDGLRASLAKAQEEVTNQQEIHNNKRKEKLDELNLFQEVRQIYSESVHSQGSDLKERVDDYTKDQTFDNGEYNARQVDKIAEGQ